MRDRTPEGSAGATLMVATTSGSAAQVSLSANITKTFNSEIDPVKLVTGREPCQTLHRLVVERTLTARTVKGKAASHFIRNVS